MAVGTGGGRRFGVGERVRKSCDQARHTTLRSVRSLRRRSGEDETTTQTCAHSSLNASERRSTAEERDSGGCGAEAINRETAPTPLLDALRARAARCGVPFFVPGHKRGRGISKSLLSLFNSGGERQANERRGNVQKKIRDEEHNEPNAFGMFAFDLTELDGLDVLQGSNLRSDNSENACLGRAQREAARVFGARSSWFLVNGSTCGIIAMMLATCKPGDAVVMPRNCHQSLLHACTIAGTMPIFITPVTCTATKVDQYKSSASSTTQAPNAEDVFGLSHGIDVNALSLCLSQLTSSQSSKMKIGLVILVSPTYFGATTDIAAAASLCHEYGIPLGVDAAHGAHLRFSEILPQCALESGADIVVESTHKTLSAMTQASMLHTNVGSQLVSDDMVEKSVALVQTSSPSYVLMASLDAARAQVDSWRYEEVYKKQKHDKTQNPIHNAVCIALEARKAISSIDGIVLLDESHLPYSGRIDVTRITISFEPLGISGHDAADMLRQRYQVEPELSTPKCVVFVITAGNTLSDIEMLVNALDRLSARCLASIGHTSQCDKENHNNNMPLLSFAPEVQYVIPAITPRDAFFNNYQTSCIPLCEAEGQISGEEIVLYPPGIPITMPGERITKLVVTQLSAAASSSSSSCIIASDNTLQTIVIYKM